MPTPPSPTSLPPGDLAARYDELQRRVTRFSVVEQQLITTRDQLDREVGRFARMHAFTTRALQLEKLDALLDTVAEAVVDVFETELGLCWLVEHDRPTAAFGASGADLDPAAAARVGAWLREALAPARADHATVLSAEHLAAIAADLPLTQGIAAVGRSVDRGVSVLLLGGISPEGAPFHDPLGVEHAGAFTVLTQQVAAIVENRRGRETIRRQMNTIRLSEERLALALAGSNAGLWDWDPSTGGLTCSAQWSALLGLPPKECHIDAWTSRILEADRPAFVEALGLHLAGRSGDVESVHRVQRADGEAPLWVLARGRALRDPSGRPYRVVGTIIDVSAQKAMEEKLREAEAQQRQAREQAESANRTKSTFLANTSHELRTPMNGVLGTLQLLHDLTPTPAQAELIDTAEQSAVALLHILDDILDLSKVEAGKLELEPRPFDPAAAVRAVAALFEARARAKGIALAVECDPALPASLLGDGGRFRQVLANLVSNAVKFTAAGRVDVFARLASGDPQPTLELEVRDTGIGIPQELHARLFSPFTQADASTSRRFGGTGLGLAISRDLVRLMGGTLWVVSAAGEGARFFVRLPAVLAAPAPPPPAPSLAAPSDLFHGTRMLVVDDNPIGQQVTSKMLQRLGVQTTLAGDGRTVLDLLETQRFDVVLMDCQMPIMDGFEATAEVRRREAATGRPRALIVALTANASPQDQAACLAAGMDDYLSKPIQRQTLREVLERCLAAAAAAAAAG
jgi:PAS domain S-box-containing protein